MSLLKQIKQRLKEITDSASAEELDLSQIKIVKFTEETKKYLQKYKNVNFLLLNGCGLESLENLPKWKLSAIDVSNNNLPDDAIKVLINYTNLNQIVATNNKISNIDGLKALATLKDLSDIDLQGNPVSSITGYRQALFSAVESLQVVDHKDRDGNDVVDEEEEFVDGSDDDDEGFDDDEDEDASEDYEEEESESEKPKKKK